VEENCALLGYYAAISGNSLPTSRDNLWVPSSGGQESLKILPIDFPATSVRNYHHALHNIPEELRSQYNHLLLKQFIVLQEKIVRDLTKVRTGCDCVLWYRELKRAYGTSPCLQTISVAFVK